MKNLTITSNELEFECENCGRVVPESDLDTVIVGYNDTEQWCSDCRGDADRCDRCGSINADPESVCIGYGYDRRGYWRQQWRDWCPNCVEYYSSVCECCDERYSEDHITSYDVYDGWGGTESRELCDDCIDEHYRVCSCCGVYVEEDDVRYSHNEDAFCPRCWEERMEHIQSYGHTSGMYFHDDDGSIDYDWSVDRSKLHLGVELEIDEFSDRCEFAELVTDDYDDTFIELKEDGSLGEDGVEVVSQPMTPLYHLESGLWERITELARQCDGSSHDSGTCGLHIHCSRGAFSDHDAVYRLDRLFHRFKSEMITFSRRTTYQLRWCGFASDVDDYPLPERKDAWEHKKLCNDRYEAVNDTNYATVEIRLWRGTLNMETLRATIEFTAGLVYVANALTNYSVEAPTWAMLKTLVRVALTNNGIPHDDLDRYLVRRGL